MRNKAVDDFVRKATEATGLDESAIDRQHAELLWRLTQRHGILIPREIDEPVARYIRREYPAQVPRRNGSAFVMEELNGASMIEGLLGLFRRKKEIDYALSCLLREPSVVDYLTKS